jgi:hypothetical protein
MNDAKWERLIAGLTDAFEYGLHIRYKLIHGEAIHELYLQAPDSKPFFAEPTLYKEIEWIEFSSAYEDYVSLDNRKAGKKTYAQDVVAIEQEIRRIGLFQLTRLPSGVRLYAYSD